MIKKGFSILLRGIVLAAMLSSFACQSGNETKDWQIVWQDDFDGPELDTSKWTKIPPNNADWGNYMTSDPMCFRLEDGKLHLLGIVNPDTLKDPRPYLTGGVYTKGKFSFQYGKIEIRAKLEGAQGAWPAIWMLSQERKYGGYPRNGEIDIMEHLDFDSHVHHTVHSWHTLELKQKKNPPQHATAEIIPEDFNTYGLEWYPDSLAFFVNGRHTFTYPKLEGADSIQWPFDQKFYLLVDQQLEGNWVGKANPDHLPVAMIIDFVKVYK